MTTVIIVITIEHKLLIISSQKVTYNYESNTVISIRQNITKSCRKYVGTICSQYKSTANCFITFTERIDLAQEDNLISTKMYEHAILEDYNSVWEKLIRAIEVRGCHVSKIISKGLINPFIVQIVENGLVFKAKASRLGAVIFDHSTATRGYNRIETLSELCGALKRNELELFF